MFAATCPDCPEGHGALWCNGDCAWDDASSTCQVTAGITCGSGVSFPHQSITYDDCDRCGYTLQECDSADCDFMPETKLCRIPLTKDSTTASVHLWFDSRVVAEPTWWFQKISPTDVTDVTYYAGVGNTFGYGGVQCLEKGLSSADRKGMVLFSIWDVGCDQDNDVACDPSMLASTIACGTSAFCEDFGNEGTGRKSSIKFTGEMPFEGEDYYMVLQQRYIPENERVQLTGYYYSEKENKWLLLSRIEVRRGYNEKYITGTYAFVEQWAAINTLDVRGALFGPSWMSDANSPTTFKQVMEAAWDYGTGGNHLHVNGWVENGAVGIETGGDVVQEAAKHAGFVYPAADPPALLRKFATSIPCLEESKTQTTADIEACLMQADKAEDTTDKAEDMTGGGIRRGGLLNAGVVGVVGALHLLLV